MRTVSKAPAQRVPAATSYVTKKEKKPFANDDDGEQIDVEHKFALDLRLETGSKGRPKLIMGGYAFFRNNSNNNKTYWLCSKSRLLKCRARIITLDGCSGMILKNQVHNHPPTEF
uniref:FLYWCH-type domain-containing protein n=1 Tax=Anopheles culicifacies TaxID=139723 RepID=A0A182MV77_9DIPT